MPNTNEINDVVDKTADSVANKAYKVAGKINAGVEETARTAARMGDKLRENGADLQDELRDAGERFAEGAKRFSDAAAEQIRAHPLAAFGVAFAIGYAATRMMRRD